MKKGCNLIYVGLVFLVFAVLGGGLGYSLNVYYGDTLLWWQSVLRMVEAVLLFCLACFMQIILHETGHMVAALIRGWKFLSFMILGMVISRYDGRFHLSRFSITGAVGQCLMSPPEDGDSDFGVAFYNAGGVVMNLFIALLSAVVLVVGYESLSWDFMVLLAFLILTGIVFALRNGIPSAIGGLPNDGKNIQNLRKDKFSTRVFLSSMQIMGKLQQGLPVEKIMSGYLCEGQAIDYANPIHQMALNFDISLAVSRLDFDKAHTLFDDLDAHKEQIVSVYQKELKLEKIYLYLAAPRPGVDVKDMLDRETWQYINMQCAFRPTALRVKYAYTLLHEHDKTGAEQLYRQFLNVCVKYHIQGEVLTEKRLVEYVRRLELPAEEKMLS